MAETVLGVALVIAQWCSLIGAVLILGGWWEPSLKAVSVLTLLALSAGWGARAKIAMHKAGKE